MTTTTTTLFNELMAMCDGSDQLQSKLTEIFDYIGELESTVETLEKARPKRASQVSDETLALAELLENTLKQGESNALTGDEIKVITGNDKMTPLRISNLIKYTQKDIQKSKKKVTITDKKGLKKEVLRVAYFIA